MENGAAHGWGIYPAAFGAVVSPENDVRPHDVFSDACWCEPFWHRHDLLVHNSADRREHYERGELKPS